MPYHRNEFQTFLFPLAQIVKVSKALKVLRHVRSCIYFPMQNCLPGFLLTK